MSQQLEFVQLSATVEFIDAVTVRSRDMARINYKIADVTRFTLLRKFPVSRIL